MSLAYVDTSCLVAVAFGEAGGAAVRRRLAGFGRLYSSGLLEAELRATFSREGVTWQPDLVTSIGWVLPQRRLSEEIALVLGAGYLRGADLWHVACALYLQRVLGSAVPLVTLDATQRAVAAAAGLQAPEP